MLTQRQAPGTKENVFGDSEPRNVNTLKKNDIILRVKTLHPDDKKMTVEDSVHLVSIQRRPGGVKKTKKHLQEERETRTEKKNPP